MVVDDVVIAFPDASAEPVSGCDFGGRGRFCVVFGEDVQESAFGSWDPGLEGDFFDFRNEDIDRPVRVVGFTIESAIETALCGRDVDVFGGVFAIGFNGAGETVGGGASVGGFAGLGEVLETAGGGDAGGQVRF